MYIGQTAQTFARRWRQHRSTLRAGRHANPHLQNSYNRHGPDAFEYRVLEVIPQGDMSDQEFNDYMNEREIILVSENDTFSNGYNLSGGGGGMLGRKVSEETRAILSAAGTGSEMTPENKAKISAALKGKKKSAEHKAKLSKANKGKKHSEATKAKIGAASALRKHSEETKAKISASAMGNTRCLGRKVGES